MTVPAARTTRTSRRPIMATVALVGAVVGIALFVGQQLVPGIVAIVLAAVLGAAAMMAKSEPGTPEGLPAERASEHAEAQLASKALREAADKLTVPSKTSLPPAVPAPSSRGAQVLRPLRSAAPRPLAPKSKRAATHVVSRWTRPDCAIWPPWLSRF